MKLHNRIEHLKTIINKYSPTDIDKIYRDYEVNFTMKSLTAWKEVRYSENMQKRMIKEAKRKRISKGRLTMIENMKNEINSFHPDPYIPNFKNTAKELLDKINQLDVNLSLTRLIHIEHGFPFNDQYVQLFDSHKYENEIIGISTNFDLEQIIGFTDKHKFTSFHEFLEHIQLDDEEYPHLFHEIYHLLAYHCIEKAFNEKSIANELKSIFKDQDLIIYFGQHDNWKFKIYEHK